MNQAIVTPDFDEKIDRLESVILMVLVCLLCVGLLRYKVDFQSMQLDELEMGEEYDIDDY